MVETIINPFNSIKTDSANSDSPYLLQNIELDFTKQQITKRAGYVASTFPGSDVIGTGNSLFKAHFLGVDGRPSYSKIIRHTSGESVVVIGERVIKADGQEPKWVELSNGREHDLGTDKPEKVLNYVVQPEKYGGDVRDNFIFAPVNYPDSAGSRRIRTFLFTYRYFNDRYGLRTPIADPLMLRILIDLRSADKNISKFYLMPSIPAGSNAPGWYQGVELFMSEVSVEKAVGYDGDEFQANKKANDGNEDKVSLSSEYVLEDLDLNFRMIKKITGVSNSSIVVGSREVELNLEFPPAPDLDGELTEVDVAVNISDYPEELTILPEGEPPDDLEHILLYAGRLWGYSRENNSIFFSYIDGDGVPRYDMMPGDHSFTVDGMQQSAVTALVERPSEQGGLYIFFRDNIRILAGQGLLSGIYSPTVLPQTDLDASGNIPNFGTLSPKSITNYKGAILFLGSDKRIYQLSGNQINDIGSTIQGHLDITPLNKLESAVGAIFDDKYILSLNGTLYIYDIQHKYWTTHDLDADGLFWSRGGVSNESIFYGVLGGSIFEMYSGDSDNGTDIDWKIVSQQWTFPAIMRFAGVYVRVAPPSGAINVKVIVDGTEIKNESFTPEYHNRFLFGFYAQGSTIQIELSGTGSLDLPIIEQVDLEFYQ